MLKVALNTFTLTLYAEHKEINKLPYFHFAYWHVLYLHGEILLKLALNTNQSINQSCTYMVTMEMRYEYLVNFSWFNRTLHDLCLWPFSTVKQPHPVIWRYKYLLIIYERHVFPIGTFVKDMHSPSVRHCTYVKDMCSPAVCHWHICERHAFPSGSPLTHLWKTCVPQMFAIHTFINKNNKIWGVPYRMGHLFCDSMQSFRVESNLCRFGFIACWYIYCC